MKRVLIGCECSGVVQDAFLKRGFDAWSCDLELSETEGPHIQDDVLNVMVRGHWDLFVVHPPCTDLAVSGAHLFAKKGPKVDLALDFVHQLLLAPIERIALENPVSLINTHIRNPTQIIQPWWFGHDTRKATCLWLKNLPLLKATNPVVTFRDMTLEMSPSPTRAKDRSRTFIGIAEAMATQWGAIL